MRGKGNLLVIDAHALLHRAFHALPPLTNKKGEPVGATFGFFSVIISTLKEISPRFLGFCFDSAAPTFRHREFIGYQSKRPTMAQELSGQIEKTGELLKKAKIAVFAKPGFEADDLIATITKKVGKKVDHILVLTGDRDLMQLVDKKVNLLLLQRQIGKFLPIKSQTVKENLGVKPSQVVDLKALTGDASDNYPGVPGIGPKTALNLLKRYDSFENIYHHLNEVGKSWKKRLIEGEEAGRLSLRLAKVFDRVPVKFDLGKMKWKQDNLLKLKDILVEEGFVSLTKRIEKFFGLEKRGENQQQSLFK